MDSPAPLNSALTDLIEVVDTLRSPGGCPWDVEQTHSSLIKYLIEETYEVVDAISRGSQPELREELGDVLLQVVLHSRLAQEHPTAPFDIEDVAAAIAAKMRRRHPHVFGDTTVRDAAEVEANWQDIKSAEKRRAHPLDDIPAAMPALVRAAKFADQLGHTQIEEGDAEIGAELYHLVVLARARGLDPETCLRDHLAELERAARADAAL